MVHANIKETKDFINANKDNKNAKEKSSTGPKGFKIQSMVCRSWENMEKDDQEFEQKYGQYALKTCIPESEKKVKGWLKKKNRAPGELGDLEKEDVYITLMTSLMGGDIHLFLNIMEDYVVNKENMQD